MDAEAGIGRESSSVLREEIHQTQADLSSKIGALEGEIRHVAMQAKERVRERVEAIQDVVDVRRYVERRPGLAAAVALGAGLILGMRRPRMQRERRIGRMVSVRGPQGGRLWSAVSPEVATLRALLVGRALGFVGDIVRQRMAARYYPETHQPETRPVAPIQ
ncbi:MAG: hypothetical protein RL518_1770 [Pseudomonadota bacterium]|jgi:ElaB/YqjD/DUF883 family membrane-anchored ribosome-binding protein